MKIKECINKIFESFPETKSISIRRYRDGLSIYNTYHVSLEFNDVFDNRISGKVKTIYTDGGAKYTCEKVFESFIFEDDKVSELLEFSHRISMNTGALDEYEIKIENENGKFSMTVPELINRHYWVNKYFENEDIEDENEEEEVENGV